MITKYLANMESTENIPFLRLTTVNLQTHFPDMARWKVFVYGSP